MRTESPLLAPVFRSEGQAHLLSVVLLDGEYSVSELAERAGVAYPTAHREVGRLLDAGIFSERAIGRTRLISANERSPLVPPLTAILRISYGPVPLLARELEPVAGIDSAFLYGSFAARSLAVAGASPNDIDLMVIGTPDPQQVYDACARVEEAVRRPVNPTVMTRDEFDGDSGFLTNVKTSPAIPVIGDLPWQ